MARPDPALMAECMTIALGGTPDDTKSYYSVVLKTMYVFCDQTDNTRATTHDRDMEVIKMAGIDWSTWYRDSIDGNAATVIALINKHYPEG